MVFINDCSTDKTGEIAESVAPGTTRMRVIHNQRNFGMGGAANTAVHAAQNDHVFWQTVDWAYDLTELRRFLELMKRFDVVIGGTFIEVPVRFMRRPCWRKPWNSSTKCRSLRDIAKGWLEFAPAVRRAARTNERVRVFRLTEPTTLHEEDIR